MLLCGIFSSGNYEIHLPDISFGYVSLPHFPWPNGDFTICFWLKTKQSGFFIEYEVAFSIKQNATLVLGLYFHNRSFEVLFGNIRRYQTIVFCDATKIILRLLGECEAFSVFRYCCSFIFVAALFSPAL